ncbi:MAG: metal ABC transporter substrate-binding protein [Fidelibacterota bacterium]
MEKLFVFVSLLISLGFCKLQIIASVTDLADIAQTIGGNRVKVSSIARGDQDPHYIEVLPSYMMKVRKADMYLEVGLELDLWAQQIIEGSRNRKIKLVDCSNGIQPLQVPTGTVDARLGDIHRLGNPHYWLDPENGKIIARTIADALSDMDPDGAKTYQKNLIQFEKDVDATIDRWHSSYQELSDLQLLFYHNSWPYFARQFNLNTVGFIETKPGIPPTPSHLNYLLDLISTRGIRVIIRAPYQNQQATRYLRQKTGIQVLTLATAVGALPGTEHYLQRFDFNLQQLSKVLENQ